ncbi:hypothetical protein ACFVYP_38090 [Kitasatospora sp. NPDC058201]|uniref:hypothetical protein n=1 Tax=unclassified Kitasatospora TaxID=2633591 RepID=UPI00365901D1
MTPLPLTGRRSTPAHRTLLAHADPLRRYASRPLTPCCMSWKYAALSSATFLGPCGFRSLRISKSIASPELRYCDDR